MAGDPASAKDSMASPWHEIIDCTDDPPKALLNKLVSAAQPPVRIAVAGAGYIGLAHIDAIQQSPLCTLSAIVDPSPASRDIAAAAGVRHFEKLDDLIAQDRPDGVVLATPNLLHVPQALQCLAAQLPVLLEKPIAPTLEQAIQLVDAVESQRGCLLIGHHRAHSPIMAQARDVIASGQLGKLVAVMGSATFYKPESYFEEGPWRREKGAGPLLLNMIHEVHNLRMLCGEIVAVQAFASRATRGFPVEDTVAISMQFDNGALGTFMLSDTAACARSWEQTSQENKAYPSYADEDCYVVTGTFGSLSVPTMRLKRYPAAEDRSWWKPFDTHTLHLVRGDPLKHQMAHFVSVIRQESLPLVSARDGMQNLKVTEAIVQAAAEGRTVHL
jgi:predicted dehydrogenase